MEVKVNPTVTHSGEPEIVSLIHRKCAATGVPAAATFELTNRCNFNCKMCYIHNGNCKGEGELTAEQWLDIGEQSKKAGVVFLLLTGGEPLIREDFPYIYTELKKMGFLITVNTNGSLLSGGIAELFSANPPSKINVSLYGADEEVYNELCGVKACSRVCENIRTIKKAGVPVVINLSITPQNRESLKEIYALSRELDCHIRATSYMYPPVRREGESTSHCRFTPEEAGIYRVKWDEIRYGEEFEAKKRDSLALLERMNDCPELTVNDNRVLCRAGRSAFWINYRGEMSGCGMVSDSVSVLDRGLMKAWEEVRAKTAEIRLPVECSACKYKPICNICAASCMAESGSYGKKPEYLCRMCESSEKYLNELSIL